ncbi:MAG: polyphosphate polymerase domain-containing protein [Lachnospiraceae bacterium]|nr:polyphosphate polymerase domain-containing protein [Lachnospiraceae bacterium]
MKNNQAPSFRHELKFDISEAERRILGKRLEMCLQRDFHAAGGMYMIRSLYFDDRWESAYTEKLSGVESRKKYRIRIYDCQDSVIKLEQKRKEGQYIQKVSVPLCREETEKLLNGDVAFLRERPERLCQDFYREWIEHQMRPAVIVDYEREAFVYPYGDVRITFDSRVRAGMLSEDLFDTKLPTAELMAPDRLIMEVKFTEYLPELVKDLLPAADSDYVAYSKYTMCLEKRKELSGIFR